MPDWHDWFCGAPACATPTSLSQVSVSIASELNAKKQQKQAHANRYEHQHRCSVWERLSPKLSKSMRLLHEQLAEVVITADKKKAALAKQKREYEVAQAHYYQQIAQCKRKFEQKWDKYKRDFEHLCARFPKAMVRAAASLDLVVTAVEDSSQANLGAEPEPEVPTQAAIEAEVQFNDTTSQASTQAEVKIEIAIKDSQEIAAETDGAPAIKHRASVDVQVPHYLASTLSRTRSFSAAGA